MQPAQDDGRVLVHQGARGEDFQTRELRGADREFDAQLAGLHMLGVGAGRGDGVVPGRRLAEAPCLVVCSANEDEIVARRGVHTGHRHERAVNAADAVPRRDRPVRARSSV